MALRTAGPVNAAAAVPLRLQDAYMQHNRRLMLSAVALVCMLAQTAATSGELHQEEQVPRAAPAESDAAQLVVAGPVVEGENENTTSMGGRLGWEIPDRTPGPPELDPSGQGMYQGVYRWVLCGGKLHGR